MKTPMGVRQQHGGILASALITTGIVLTVLVLSYWWLKNRGNEAGYIPNPIHAKIALQKHSPIKRKKTMLPFDITGPLKNRPLLHKVIPAYPPWAEEQGLSILIRVYVEVTSEGTVKPAVKLVQSSNDKIFDDIVIKAVRQWRFASAPIQNSNETQWGVIRFWFRILDPTLPT